MPEAYTEALQSAEHQISTGIATIVALAGLGDGRRIAARLIEDALALEHHRRYGRLEAQH